MAKQLYDVLIVGSGASGGMAGIVTALDRPIGTMNTRSMSVAASAPLMAYVNSLASPRVTVTEQAVPRRLRRRLPRDAPHRE